MAAFPEITGYRIESELGKGGMARVYLAWDEKLERHVALKTLLRSFCEDENVTARFVREAKTAAKLKHSNIVSIYDVGHCGQEYYFTMEQLEGSLKDRLSAGPMELPAALLILRQVVAAIAHAHSQGLIHRDIKPDNIMFRADGSVVLVDFGIARTMDSATKLTKTGMSIGTPHYMSPEQARGQAIDGRSDLYSLGIVLYEMLVGSLPYNADESIALALMHIQAPIPVFPAQYAPYQDFLNKLLAKEPNDRFQNGLELLQAIDDILSTQKPAAGFSPHQADLHRRSKQTEIILKSRTEKKEKAVTDLKKHSPGQPARKIVLIAMLSVLLVLLLILVIVLSQKKSQPAVGPGITSQAQIPSPAGGGGGTIPVSFAALLKRGREALAKGDTDSALQQAAAARQVAADEYQRKRLDIFELAIKESLPEVKVDKPLPRESPAELKIVQPGLQKGAELPSAPVEKPKDIHRAGEVWREPKTGIEMAFMPSGEFSMGSNSGVPNESPPHTVSLRGFWIGKTEVTQGQWLAVLGENPSRFNKGDTFPVEMVSWDKAMDFIKKLNELTGGAFRLPSEAEWEYACRSGKGSDRYGDLDDIAWHRSNAKEQTHPVGEKKADAWGLYDMLGNVWEWCEDFYDEDYYKKSTLENPQGPLSGEFRVIRGGSWFRPAEFIRAMYRNFALPGLKNDNLGIRLAKDQ
jgi:serine/threonine protein kinase/formylglycine-generating enzyme required for sulfatase activity